MPERPDWIVFYEDGSRFSSQDGQPWEAPAVGAVVLIQVDANGKWVFYTQDTGYCWGWRSNNEWVACDLVGIIDYLFHHSGPKAVLFGRWTSDDNYEHVRQEAEKAWRGEAHG